MYQELQRKKIDLQLKRPYSREVSAEIKKLDQLDQIYSALVLEGGEFTRADVQGMMEGEMPKKASLKECIFVQNYQRLLEMMQDSLDLKSDLDSRMLAKFHNVLTGQVTGFRKSNMMHVELKHVPPHSSDIEMKLNQLFRSVYSSRENEIRNAARIHCGVLEIYPFEEYSGVIARIAMNYYLQEKGFLPVALGYNYKEYISTMAECFKDSNVALFFWGLERAEYNKLVQVLQIVESEEDEF